MKTLHAQSLMFLASSLIAYGCGGDGTSGSGTGPVMGAPSAGMSATTTAVGGSPASGAAGTAGSKPASNTAPASSAGTAGKSGSSTPVTGGSAMATAGSTATAAGAPAMMAAAGSGTAGVAGAPAGNAAGTGAAPPSTAGKLPRVMTTDGPGPFTEVVKVKNTPPGGWLIYPKDIGKDGIKHPLFIFGPGGGTTPDTYEMDGMHWDRYGSYGFVIYCLPMSTGDAAPMKNGLDWLIKQNDDMSSPLYQHLDTTKVCAAGHSQGSITVFAFMPDDRVTTTINISGGSFDGMGPSHLKNESMFLCGPDGNADIAEPQCETDFMNTKVPTFYTKIQGATHITSGRLGWAASIAWMLWHLADQGDQWKKEFMEPTGQFQTGIYKSQLKNWP
jgi:hypothetical protein